MAGLSQQISVLQESVALEKRRALNLLLPQEDGRGEEKGSVLLVLDMELHDIKGKELEFVDDVSTHVSKALGVSDDGWISVTSLQSGSIKARLGFGPGTSQSGITPADAVSRIKAQAESETSPLRAGALGSKIKGVESTGVLEQEGTSPSIAAQTAREAEAVIAVSQKSPARATRTAKPSCAHQPASSTVPDMGPSGEFVEDNAGLVSFSGESLPLEAASPQRQRNLESPLKGSEAQDISVMSNWSTSTLRESELQAVELLANEKVMHERVTALESLMSEKDGLIELLEDQGKVSEKRRQEDLEKLRELQRVVEEKESHIYTLQLRIQEMEAVNLRTMTQAQNGTSGAPLQSASAGGASRAALQSNDSTSAQLLQFQSTLRKAEAALAEQSTIVEGQAAELVEAHKIIDSAENQKKMLQLNLERVYADLEEHREIANSVTAQVEKLSKKNAELTKELAQHQQRAQESKETHERLRNELANALDPHRQGPGASIAARGDLTLEIDAQRQVYLVLCSIVE